MSEPISRETQTDPNRAGNAALALDPRIRIGDLVLELPAAVRVFEALGIDYCCGGQRSLAAACTEAGQDLQEVLAQLDGLQAKAPEPGDRRWADAPLGELIDHIEATHHAFTRSELGRMAPLMEKVLRVHGEHHPELADVAELFEALAGELVPHLEKEERILFPFVRALESGQAPSGCFGTVQSPIRVMMSEHDHAGEILRELRSLTGGYAPPADACGSFRSLYLGLASLEEDLHRHIHLENNLLFPRAIALEQARR